MDRILEPELMTEEDQVEAYAKADFEEPHGRLIDTLESELFNSGFKGNVLDIGCGPGDICFRFVRRFPHAQIIAVDGSAAMIKLANMRKKREKANCIEFVEGFVPEVELPEQNYELIMSSSLLHHLPDPSVLWETIKRYAASGTKIFMYDLFRPPSEEDALHLVNLYTADEPEVLKRDFYNSLLAAFEPDEIREQIELYGLAELSVKQISDRHVIAFGTKT